MKNAKSYLLSAVFAHMAAVRRQDWYAGRTGTPPRPKRRRPPISGASSWRQLCRAVARGDVKPQQPSIHARLRHKWFQKEALWAGLRIRAGQDLPGDRELIDAVRIVIKSQAHARQNIQK